MKRFFIPVILLFSIVSFSQEIYSGEYNTKFYLFLGSYQGVDMKMLDTMHKTVQWINIDSANLNQVGILSPVDFIKTILSNQLYFQVNSIEQSPWTAQIKDNSFYINDLQNNFTKEIPIHINFNDPTIYLSFEDDNKNLKGSIKRISQEESNSLCSSEEIPLWKTTFTFNNRTYEGCTYIKNN